MKQHTSSLRHGLCRMLLTARASAALRLCLLFLAACQLCAVVFHHPRLRPSLDDAVAKRCFDVPLEGNSRVVQRCCPMGANGGSHAMYCVPNIIVVGWFKTGTTLLHSYLMMHPQIRTPPEKENRFFVDDARYSAFVQGRLPMAYLANSLAEASAKVNLDSSAGIIQDPLACKRIARFASPDARFVAVLRNPVERLWSQYLMDRRRGYVAKLEAIARLTPSDYAHYMACVDDGACSFHRNVTFSSASNLYPVHTSALRTLFRYLRQKLEKDAFFSTPGVRCFASQAAMAQCIRTGAFADFVQSAYFTQGGALSIDVAAVANMRADAGDPALIAAHGACLQCSDASSLRAGSSARGARTSWVTQPLHRARGDDDLYEECTGCRCACMDKLRRSSLATSLYSVALEHCLSFLPRHRVLIVDYNEVVTDPAGVASRVAEFSGLQPFDFKTMEEYAETGFDEAYPHFKRVTGWADTDFPAWFNVVDLPAELRRDLNAFYRPDVARLREVTGLKLESWTQDGL